MAQDLTRVGERSVSEILVTGATGFVGRELCRQLVANGYGVRGTCRRSVADLVAGTVAVALDGIGPNTRWERALAGVGAVVHLAARVHVMHDRAPDPLAEFRDVNTHGTENLARQAAAAGVRRMVFVSSIKVNGEATHGQPFSERDPPAPQDPYGVSKREAEQALQQIATETGLEVAIIRPPLVYGPNVGGNFLRMLRLIDSGIPLPLAAVRNRRSLVSIWNLCDFLQRCATHPGAAGQTFLISDGEDLSTPDLFRRLAEGLGRKPRLFDFPARWLDTAGRLLGQSAVVERLTGSLQVDSRKARELLGWRPPVSVADGLRRTAEWYRRRREAVGERPAGIAQ
jgi:UDP-glucose 4-epimerase